MAGDTDGRLRCPAIQVWMAPGSRGPSGSRTSSPESASPRTSVQRSGAVLRRRGMITSALDPPLPVTPAESLAGTDLLRATIVNLQVERGAELWGLARHLGLSPDEADDAVQETLVRLWSALRDGQDIQRMDAWAFRTLYRLAMDKHRLRRRVRALAERIGA